MASPRPLAAKILVVEDELLVAKDLASTLRRLGYEVSYSVDNGRGALAAAAAERPDLVLMDVNLKGEMDGIQTASELVARYQVPVVFLTAFADETTVARASAVQAFGYLIKPFTGPELNSAIRIALEKSRGDAQVRERAAWLEHTLQSFGDRVIRAEVNASTIGLDEQLAIELRLLHAAMRFLADGIARLDTEARYVYVSHAYAAQHGYAEGELIGKRWDIVISGDDHDGGALYETMLRTGKGERECIGLRKDGSTFFKHLTLIPAYLGGRFLGHYAFSKDISERKRQETALRDANAELQRKQALLEELSIRDELTGLLNRRELNRVLSDECSRSQRHKHPMTLLLVDVDRFKHINDNYGHDAGDEVLAEIGRRVQASIRGTDRAARFGGEELALILPETPSEGALVIAERVRANIARPMPVVGLNGAQVELRVTASIGIAEFGRHAKDDRELVRAADAALYAAKCQGRDRALRYSELPEGAVDSRTSDLRIGRAKRA